MVKTIYSVLCMAAFCLLASPMYAATARVAAAATEVTVTTNPTEATITEKAASDWNNLSAKEKRMKRKEVKQAMKDAKESGADANLLLLVILAILLPPLAMAIYDGITTRFWLSLLLTILGFLPGIIYTLFVILSEN